MATRKIRLDNGKTKRIVSGGKKKIVTKANHVQEAKRLLREAGPLSEEEAKMLIDYGQGLQDDIAHLSATVGDIKEKLRLFASINKVKNLKAEVAQMVASSSTKSETGSATQLVALLKKMKKVKAADAMLKIQITEAKKYLGEQTLRDEGLYKTKTTQYASISIKPL